MQKAKYMARVCYDDDFKPEMEKFIRLINLDKEINKLKLKNSNQRFSAVIRYLIKKYNEAREPKIMEEIKLRKESLM